jgi:hypothetical protein
VIAKVAAAAAERMRESAKAEKLLIAGVEITNPFL